MAPLAVALTAETAGAFEQAARTMALAEPGTDAPALMARLVATLAQLDAGEALAAVPCPAGAERTLLPLSADALADLDALARRLGIEPAEAAARILAGVAAEGPSAALVAVNSRRITRRRKEGSR
ncbi:MAG: hypothetical protein FJZ01_09170 [Candidatus Sericytochromatia bacterium]|nr:hypothetical protein [Candidatus Tanganyikabacteria bacterium]